MFGSKLQYDPIYGKYDPIWRKYDPKKSNTIQFGENTSGYHPNTIRWHYKRSNQYKAVHLIMSSGFEIM
ncbi:hypothetical protein [Virgibacillus oceani]|uniref:hypothetical protein n=1 Tax=Virgibacillus oceani TaxID=1479511 RepID=UPI00166CBCBF|nr:hypothetical protein [Virgibacillus oceani]